MRRVLIVDDSGPVRETISDWLVEDGFAVADVGSLEEARSWLDANGAPHVLLLDVRLQGPGGEVSGLDAVGDLLVRAPGARVVIITGFAAEADVIRAFDAGAHDYVVKDSVFNPLLRRKVRRAAEEADRTFQRQPTWRERELRDAWSAARSNPHPQRKGEALERTLQLLFDSVPGLTADNRVHSGNRDAEYDLWITNGSSEPVLRDQGLIWLVECKNRAEPRSTDDVYAIEGKMRRHRGRCRLGFLVATSGFTRGAEDVLRRASTGGELVVLLDEHAVSAWIASADREAWLSARVSEATRR